MFKLSVELILNEALNLNSADYLCNFQLNGLRILEL